MKPVPHKSYELFTKSAIPYIFKKYSGGIDPIKYHAAAQVFPMRVNSHVLDDLIDW